MHVRAGFVSRGTSMKTARQPAGRRPAGHHDARPQRCLGVGDIHHHPPVAAVQTRDQGRDPEQQLPPDLLQTLDRCEPRQPGHPGRGAHRRVEGRPQVHLKSPLRRRHRQVVLLLPRGRPTIAGAIPTILASPTPWWLSPISVNQSKGDRDPIEWLQPCSAERCTYAIQWVQVKYRWRLGIDSAERSRLSMILSGNCGSLSTTMPTRAT